MTSLKIALLATVAAAPLMAQEHREMDAHVHGVSTLEIAVEGGIVELNLLSPGIDLVGFEYEASTAEDKDAVETAIKQLLRVDEIFALPDAAECRLTEVLAHLHTGEHDDHDEEEEHEDHDEHEDHEEGEMHEDGDEGGHNEFHAHYLISCDHPEALTTIDFPFFEQFPNAQEIEVEYVTDAGAGAAEIERDATELALD